jgi:hypothetical protein
MAGCEDQVMKGYDIIGDIHGCASALEALLAELGYRLDDSTDAHAHPNNQAIFVGDLVDRGDEQLRVLEIVKRMVDSGSAQVVMGNHEFNAICYATEYPAGNGHYLRKHTDKNYKQHRAFLEQLSDEQCSHYLEWFKTMPLWLDLGAIRVVHACWHEASMKYVESQLGSNQFNSLDQLVRASDKNDPLYEAVEILLKGPEISLVEHNQPAYQDKDGHLRSQARIRWWIGSATTLREIAEIAPSFTTEDGNAYPPLPNIELAENERSYVYTGTVPVFFGHYWRNGSPRRIRDWTEHCACLDFSAVKGGKLTAYRWRGETTLDEGHFLQVAG